MTLDAVAVLAAIGGSAPAPDAALAHATSGEIRPVPARIAVAVLAGFLAAGVAGIAALALPEGDVPPRVALRAAWPDVPRNVVPVASRTAHYLAGIALGVGIELVVVALDAARTTHVLFLGYVTVARLGAAALIGFGAAVLFAALVLPSVGPDAVPDYESRAAGIRRDGYVVAGVFAVAAALLVPALYLVLPV